MCALNYSRYSIFQNLLHYHTCKYRVGSLVTDSGLSVIFARASQHAQRPNRDTAQRISLDVTLLNLSHSNSTIVQQVN